jgi:hypothetical protein
MNMGDLQSSVYTDGKRLACLQMICGFTAAIIAYVVLSFANWSISDRTWHALVIWASFFGCEVGLVLHHNTPAKQAAGLLALWVVIGAVLFWVVVPLGAAHPLALMLVFGSIFTIVLPVLAVMGKLKVT